MGVLVVLLMFFAQGPARTARIADAVITGTISSSEGLPAEGLRVIAMPLPDGTTTQTMASLAQTDSLGRFRLEDLPAGSYYITVGALEFPSFYPGVKSQAEAVAVTVEAGKTVSGINFRLVRPFNLRVTGRILGFPRGTPPGLVRANLAPNGNQTASGPMEVPVQADGTYEFLKVSPGRYALRFLPAVAQPPANPLMVDDKDVSIDVPVQTAFIVGRVVVDDGSKLPVATNPANPEPPALVNLVAFRPTPGGGATVGGRGGGRGGRGGGIAGQQVGFAPRADGFFIFTGAPGEYQVVSNRLPYGYSIKSVSVKESVPQIQVTLTTEPSPAAPPGVKVSGRITGIGAGLAGGPLLITAQGQGGQNALGGAEQRIAEAPVRSDGTFEILRVTPGLLNLNLSAPGGGNLAAGTQFRLNITDKDVFVEFSVTSQASQSSPAAASGQPPPTPLTMVVPDLVVATNSAPRSSGLRVSGKVVGKFSAAAVESPRIALVQGGQSMFAAPIGADGAFEFSDVSAGKYSVQLSLQGNYTFFDFLTVRDTDIVGMEVTSPGP
jgi:hypothetical protein